MHVSNIQTDSGEQGDTILMSLVMPENVREQAAESKKCVECGIDIDIDTLSFEQKLIEDEDFCRRCWDRVMDDTDDVKLPSLTIQQK